jgi:hypothetical protein
MVLLCQSYKPVCSTPLFTLCSLHVSASLYRFRGETSLVFLQTIMNAVRLSYRATKTKPLLKSEIMIKNVSCEPGWLSRYSYWATGWTTEEPWFDFYLYKKIVSSAHTLWRESTECFFVLLKWVGNVAHMGENGGSYKISGEKPEERRSFGKTQA